MAAGSRYWLDLALRRLLGLLIEAAPAGIPPLLRMRQIGFRQLVTADVNHNQPAPAALDQGLARVVAELHRGTLKTATTEKGVLHQFTLILPTGQPQALRQRPDCANCPSMNQAEQYPEDIGELLNAMQTQEQQISNRSRK